MFLVGYVLVRADYATNKPHNLWFNLSSLLWLKQVCWRSGKSPGQLSFLGSLSDPNCFHLVAPQREASSGSTEPTPLS